MIDTVKIRNFKCFVSEEIPFGPLTLLTGVNSSGKSTTIQSLLLLRQSWLAGFDSVVLNGDLVKLGNPNDVLSEGAEEDLNEEDAIEIGIGGNGQLLEFEFGLQKDKDDFEIRKVPKKDVQDYFGLFGTRFQYLRAERLGPRTSFLISSDHVVRHRELGASGEYTAHYLSVHGAVPVLHSNLLRSEASSKSLLAQTEAWLSDISPGVQLSVAEHQNMDLVSLSVSFAIAGQVRSDPYRPTNVGFGLTYVLPVLVALLSARSGDIVIVENPEAHLHPKGQGQVGRMLALAAEAGVQVVVETHSDHILNGIRIAAKRGEIAAEKVRINYFHREMRDDGSYVRIVTPVLDRDGRFDKWPRGFFDEWENSLDSLLD